MHINRPFHIVSGMSNNRHLDAIGQEMVIKTPNGRTSQVFYFDYKTRTIRSKDNNYALDMRNTKVHKYQVNSQWYQLFKYQDGKFVNQQGKVLDVVNSNDSEGEKTIA